MLTNLYLQNNLSLHKKKNALITEAFKNDPVNLLDWLGVDLENGSTSEFLNKRGEWETISSTAPSAPTNSVQYNNAGAFGGDANFTRNPTTFATVINALSAPTVGGIFQLSNTILQIGYTDTPSTINSGVRFNSTSSSFRYTNSSTDLRIISNGTNLRIGDTESTFNDTLITLDDINKTILAVGDGITFGIGTNSSTGNKAFLATTADGDNLYGVFSDKTTGLADHLSGIYSINSVTGQGSSIFTDYNSASNEHGVLMNWDSATPSESTRLTINSEGLRFLNQTTLDVFFQVDITGNVILPQINTYADDAAADADTALVTKSLYKLTGDRTIYQKP